ncbi:HNH endonuclease signature motif containing protein [Blastococcus sp. TF02A_35]|uniref:HNH endonuclease signature motif containing protein n=1 Tax=Blastococcus sp. TF02A-35 TaxID=2559612 RepID=UPI0010742835|nr:HNH endonuclease signature motif containing protein [Blastococcus sp. TF02A_35]TFV48180.1 HNH endonuclease [Blastococcus sp. TF02A_35]
MRSNAAEVVEAALDELSAQRLDGMFGPQLLERLGELLTAQNRLAAEVARTVRQCELADAAEVDGKASMKAWLRGHARFSASAANALVSSGRALQQMPALATAAADGEVSAGAVAAIAPVAAPGKLEAAAALGVDLAEIDLLLTDVARNQFHPALRRAVAHYLDRLDPDGPEPDPTEQRSLTFSKHPDGTVSGRFDLDAVGGEKAQAVIESLVQACRPAGDTRTRAQQQADAFVQLCDNALAAGRLPVLRTSKPHVVVTIPIDDLVDPVTGQGAADLGFGATISAARARWLACDGTVTRIVLGPEGQPLDLGRSHRVVPHHLRRAVEARDGGCVFAGCDAPSHWCDVHHLVHWADGGDTSLENSGLLCERHHTKVHHGFRVERQPDGRWRTWRPDGTEILLLPRVVVGTASPRAG